MAQFRAIIRGQRGEAIRLGSKQSGIVAHVDGWHTGAIVHIDYVDGRDRVSVYRTSGSSAGNSPKLVAQWFAAEPVTLGEAVKRPDIADIVGSDAWATIVAATKAELEA